MKNIKKKSGNKYSRKSIVDETLKLVSDFSDIFNYFKKKNSEFRVYYCNHVSQLVEILTKFGKTIDLTLQHDVFKHLFGRVILKDHFQFEKEGLPKKIDIYSLFEELRIEVKTISELTLKKLKEKITYVFKYHPNNEKLWLFYFLKLEFPDNSINKNKELDITINDCKYLLVFISILILGEEDLSDINNELESGVEEIIERAAEKLDVEKEIIIPLGNVIISEELRRKLKEKEKELEKKGEELEKKDKELEKERREKEKYKKELIELKKQLEKYRKK
ncbi:MAG: hypothetical protein ACTSPY_03420 [Candidatus Helarchaeota archaeon]